MESETPKEMQMTKPWLVLGGLLLTASAAAAQAPDGKALYDANCKKCHGADGVPAPAMKKMMATLPTIDAAFMAKVSDADLVKALTEGKGAMKPFKDKLTAEQIEAVAKYTRELTKGK